MGLNGLYCRVWKFPIMKSAKISRIFIIIMLWLWRFMSTVLNCAAKSIGETKKVPNKSSSSQKNKKVLTFSLFPVNGFGGKHIFTYNKILYLLIYSQVNDQEKFVYVREPHLLSSIISYLIHISISIYIFKNRIF